MSTATSAIPKIDLTKSTTNCCTLINPADWDEKDFTFKDQRFVKVRSKSILHVPLNIGQVMKDAQAHIDNFNARADSQLILSDETSPWHADHYIAVTRDIPDMEVTTLPGEYLTRVFEGPYSKAGKWQRQLTQYAENEGGTPIKTYFFYTVCPKCAKAYGKNYVVGFEQVG